MLEHGSKGGPGASGVAHKRNELRDRDERGTMDRDPGVCKQLSSVVQFQGVGTMRIKILVVLIAVAVMGVSSAAMAGGGGGGKGGSAGGVKGGSASGVKGGSVGQFGHAHFGRAHFGHRFKGNPFLLGGWGLGGWGWGPYDDGGYSNTNVVVYPQATPQMATGSVAATPCHWNAQPFDVPSSGGGNRPVQVVTCQ